MAQRTFTGVTIDNQRYILTAPASGTVQNLINSAVKQTWYKFPLRGLRFQGRFLNGNTKLSNLTSLEDGAEIHLVPKMSRMGMNPNNMRAAKAKLENFFSQQPPRGGKSRRSSKKSRKARQTRKRR